MEKKRSKLWTVFTARSEDLAQCTICKADISTKGGSTGNMGRHLKRKHPFQSLDRQDDHNSEDIEMEEEPSIINEPGQSASHTNTNHSVPGESNTSEGKTAETSTNANPSATTASKQPASQRQAKIKEYGSRPVTASKKNHIDRLLAQFLCKGYHAISLIEEPSFKKLVHALNSNYSLPTRKTMSNTIIPKVYEEAKEKVKKELESAATVASTTDGWTSEHSKQNYQALTIHFINKDCILKSFMLDICLFNDAHTADNLAKLMKKVLEDWELEKKVLAMASDNAKNITAAIREAGYNQIACFAHCLNLAVKAGLIEIEEVQNKIKCIATHFNRSPQAIAKLHKTQEQMGTKQLKLKNDCPTRWNSTWEMFQRIIEIKDAVISTIAVHCPEVPMLTESDWKVAEQSCNFLELFEMATKDMSGEQVVTLPKVLIHVDSLRNHCNEWINSQESKPDVALMASSTLRVLNEKFGNIYSLPHYAESTFLDPRFKKEGVPASLFEKTKKTIINKCGQVRLDKPTQSEHQAPATPENTTPSKMDKLWQHFDSRVKPLLENRTATAANTIEVDRYLKEDLLPRKEDPLQWWKERKSQYPRLYEVMKRRLCIPATSVPCERVFSKSGQLIRDRRSRLDPKRVGQMMFIHANT